MGELRIENMTKVFGGGSTDIVAVKDLNLTVQDGEFLVLVGPSGCGKSTTLRCIAGLETLTEGDITLDGESLVDKRPMDRDIAMVFQNYALYPHMTARQNMAFGLKMTTDLSGGEIDEKVTEAAELMGIEELLEKRPSDLSGGQQQRVALGRAIVREPSVFLMDEPLSNLDAKLRVQMRTELQNLQQELGITTIYVTHDQTEAMTMGDKIAVLNDGKMQQLGTPLECYHEPANRFVAGFIGSPSMNIFDVELDDGALDHTAFSHELSHDTVEELSVDSGLLTLGIRPEDIRIVTGGSPPDNAVTTEVQVVEPMGSETVVYVELGGQTVTVSTAEEHTFQPGEDLVLHFPENLIHLFDRSTGDAVRNREWSATETQTPTKGLQRG